MVVYGDATYPAMVVYGDAAGDHAQRDLHSHNCRYPADLSRSPDLIRVYTPHHVRVRVRVRIRIRHTTMSAVDRCTNPKAVLCVPS